jgi:hypothetical protein
LAHASGQIRWPTQIRRRARESSPGTPVCLNALGEE